MQYRNASDSKLDENSDSRLAISRRGFVGAAALAGLGLAGALVARGAGASETQDASAASEKAASSSDGASSGTAKADHATPTYPVTIVDRSGREVTVESADAVVTLCATGFDRMLVIGEADRVVGNFGSLSEWGLLVNGGNDVNNLGGGNVAADPDVEVLNSLGTDVLYCWQEAIDAGNVTDPNQADFAAICAQLSTGNPTTVDEFRDYLTSEIYLYSDAVANDDATARANAWVDYMNETFDSILAKTSGLSDDERPAVYYARGGKGGDDPFNSFLKSSYPDFLIQIAGGVNVSDQADGESYGDVTSEQIAVWNPQVIFCGRIADPSAITGDATFSETDAVKNGEVYVSPTGVMEWDTGSECILNALYLAKTLHPDLFEDVDMEQEVKDYYATFFDTELTDAQVQNLLARQSPDAQ
jgi:iron complex transport system substrate-binding protein